MIGDRHYFINCSTSVHALVYCKSCRVHLTMVGAYVYESSTEAKTGVNAIYCPVYWTLNKLSLQVRWSLFALCICYQLPDFSLKLDPMVERTFEVRCVGE